MSREDSRIPAGRSSINRANGRRVPDPNTNVGSAPIRLTGGDAASSDFIPEIPGSPRPSQSADKSALIHDHTERPRRFPDVAELPIRSQELSLMEGPPSDLTKKAGYITEHSSERANDQPETARPLEQGVNASSSSSVAVSPPTSVPTGTDLAQLPSDDRILKEIPIPTVVDLGTKPMPRAPDQPTQSNDPPAQAHQETETTITSLKTEQSTSTLSAPAVRSPVTSIAPTRTEDFPPLPLDVHSPTEVGDSPTHAVSRTMLPSVITTAISGSADDLPQLPADVSSSTSHRQESRERDGQAIESKSDAVETPMDAAPAAIPLPVAIPMILPSITTDPPATTLSINVGRSELRTADAEAIQSHANDRAVRPHSEPKRESSAMESVVGESRGARVDSTMIENPPALPSRADSFVPARSNPPSTLRPELKREVETIVRKQEDELRIRQQMQAQAALPARDTIVSDLRAQTQLDISRAEPRRGSANQSDPRTRGLGAVASTHLGSSAKVLGRSCHLPPPLVLPRSGPRTLRT